MNESSQNPHCPRCKTLLVQRGRVKDVGYYKKWVEQWYCETHGYVDASDIEARSVQVKN